MHWEVPAASKEGPIKKTEKSMTSEVLAIDKDGTERALDRTVDVATSSDETFA